MMKHKKHQPTPQDLYRARKQREEEEKVAILPPGLINHGNTCFMNSTLQGLMATELLHNLIRFQPISPSLQNMLGPPLLSWRSPQLTNGHGLGGQYEQPRVDNMPLGDVFIDVMCKAWDLQENRKRESMSPKELLFTMGRKYDQYLDFRQQDAHEFLRHMLDAMRMEELDVIKQRQPPPSDPRRRSRKKPAPPPPSAPAPGDEEKLQSFVDMLFGGQLASILVCEKCKKVSLTYEEFNDLSLSIKPEDYVKDRKRDRFKMLARKLRGQFRPPPDKAMHRSSSVPADPLRRSLEVVTQENDPPVNEGPRRRSFDHVSENMDEHEARDEVPDMVTSGSSPPLGAAEDEDTSADASEGKERDKDAEPASEQETQTDAIIPGPEHERKKEKKEKDDPWGRFGRRLSVSVKKGMKALDPGSPSRSVERGRKVSPKSKDKDRRMSKDYSESESGKPSVAAAVRAYDSGSDAADVPDVARLRIGSPLLSPSPLTNPPITAPLRPQHPKRGTALGGKQKKSPHAPKPSRQEAAYLHKLLADVHTQTGNPFSMIHHAIAGGAHSAAAQAAWAKMTHLPGIEDCLRMFTAVEILEGDNMVGCHRCWKIANGLYKPRRQDMQGANEDGPASEGASSEGTEKSDEKLADGSDSAEAEQGASPPTEARSITSESMVASSETTSAPHSVVSLTDNVSDTTSLTAPTSIGSKTPTPLVSPTRPMTYGGLLIPSISTTGPESPLTPPVAAGAAEGDDVGPRLSSTTQTSSTVPFPSDKSLLTPRGRRRARSKIDGADVDSDSCDDDESYESDSDVSASTSAYSDASPVASPSASPRTSVENLTTDTPSSADRSKVPMPDTSTARIPRSQQVILRRMYKRYLIAEPPPILVVHLKRFQQTNRTYTYSFTGAGGVKKLDEYVAFPEYLDLAPYLAPRREDFTSDKAGKEKGKEPHRCMYRLYAVVVHIGNMLGGHYIAYTALPSSQTEDLQAPIVADGSALSPAVQSDANPMDGVKPHKPQRQWAYISDTIVRLTTLDEVLKAKAYICMYERI
ncbi:cysteine proteinase [Wolfiporia cocos MD-104 SS10]|uniref:ubiquitinyl hydrolase 1 n=1 Tax=Wolfiporia cocos (strain MD-104) TaxID=742152 RepID=A0A2H3JRW2_WOLCO|nr:cysteine proteinase [Wolfiporia cocos MD-104 SS10]